jgi:hypothetical protein
MKRIGAHAQDRVNYVDGGDVSGMYRDVCGLWYYFTAGGGGGSCKAAHDKTLTDKDN